MQDEQMAVRMAPRAQSAGLEATYNSDAKNA